MLTRVKAAGLAAACTCILVRVFALKADPPRFLTWSGATDTDEGFYTLDARHRAAFGTAAPGDFHDRTLAPLLSWTQQGWYCLFGTSVIAARTLDVVCGLACVALLAWGLHRTGGERAAWWGVVLLGLCPPFVFYNRLALQETPAVFLLTASWVLWTESPAGRGGVAFLAGVLLALSVAVKMLCVVFLPVVLVLVWKERQRGMLFGLGLAVTCMILLCIWVWPAYAELARFSVYYQDAQAGAGGTAHVLWNVRRFLIGDAMGARRGFVPYMVAFCPVIVWLAAMAVWRRKLDPFLAAWATGGILYCAFSSYAPDRYYVCFLPALAGIAAIEAAKQDRYVQIIGSGVVLFVSLFWLENGLTHLTFSRQLASEALSQAISPRATVIGDTAPALCISTDLRAAPVQPGLSNTIDPVAQTGASYLVTGREALWAAFWAKAEPGVCVPERRLLTVKLASGRVADLYRVR